VERFVLYGLFGWGAEIVWTALSDIVGALRRGAPVDRRLAGHTYLWMFPIYGAGGLLFELVHRPVADWPWVARGLVYMIGCFVVEYATGWLIKRLSGTIPWDYSAKRWHVHGLIRLDYAPVWFMFGLILESVMRAVNAAAPAVRMVVS
jgi:uncharacterized membrane protein